MKRFMTWLLTMIVILKETKQNIINYQRVFYANTQQTDARGSHRRRSPG